LLLLTTPIHRPGFMNFQVFASLMGDYVRLWVTPTTAYSNAVKVIMSNVAESLTNKHTNNYLHLRGQINVTLQTFFDRNQEEVANRLSKLIVQECSPSTENHYLWDTINKIRNDRIEKKIKAMSDGAVHVRTGNPVNYAPAPGYVKKDEVIAMLKSTLEGDISNEAQEVQDMIDMLSAYWKLAMKRYIDHVAMIITDLFTHPSLVKEMEQIFSEQIIKITDDHLAGLFAQKRKLKRNRTELERKVKAMQEAKKRLEMNTF
jgi:hypothetical protein